MVEVKVQEADSTELVLDARVVKRDDGREYVVVQETGADGMPEHVQCEFYALRKEAESPSAPALPPDPPHELPGHDDEASLQLLVYKHGKLAAKLLIRASEFVTDMIHRQKMAASLGRALFAKYPKLSSEGVRGKMAFPVPAALSKAEALAADSAFSSSSSNQIEDGGADTTEANRRMKSERTESSKTQRTWWVLVLVVCLCLFGLGLGWSKIKGGVRRAVGAGLRMVFTR
jgi:hypothetical protein